MVVLPGSMARLVGKEEVLVKRIYFREVSWRVVVISAIVAALCGSSSGTDRRVKDSFLSSYDKWEAVGRLAGDWALNRIRNVGVEPQRGNLIVMTNAGYVEVDGESSSALVDGLAVVTGISRGQNTLVEVHSAFWDPLWSAIYDRESGYCVYLEVDAAVAAKMSPESRTPLPGLFRNVSIERIDAEHMLRHASEWQAKLRNKIFGGNEFRVVTIANIIASGAPAYLVRPEKLPPLSTAKTSETRNGKDWFWSLNGPRLHAVKQEAA